MPKSHIYEQAKRLYEESLVIMEKVAGSDSQAVADLLMNFAALHKQHRDYSKALVFPHPLQSNYLSFAGYGLLAHHRLVAEQISRLETITALNSDGEHGGSAMTGLRLQARTLQELGDTANTFR